MNEPVVLTQGEVAELLRVDVATLNRNFGSMLLRGFPDRLPGLGKTVRYPRQAVLDWIERAGRGGVDPLTAEQDRLDHRAKLIAARLG